MVKVLHVISDSGIGGAGIWVLNLLRHLDPREFEPVLALPPGSLLQERAEAMGVRCVKVGTADRSFSPRDTLALMGLVRREKPSLLHTHASFSARVANSVFHTCPVIVTKHCSYSPTERQKTAFYRHLYTTFEKWEDPIHIATADSAEAVLTALGTDPRRIVRIPGGSESVAVLGKAEKSDLRRSLGIGENDFVVGLAARLEPGKGQEDLIAAARLLVDRPHIRFLIVGGGSMEESLKKSASDCSNVSFTGFRPDIGAVMNLFDVNVNCSYLSETSSLSLSEGMSLGLPMIVTDCGGNRGMAARGGLTVPCRDPKAFAEAILRLWEDRALYERLSAGAKRAFEEDYTAEGMAKKTEALYRRCLSEARGRHF